MEDKMGGLECKEVRTLMELKVLLKPRSLYLKKLLPEMNNTKNSNIISLELNKEN